MLLQDRNLLNKNGDVYETFLAQLSDYYFGEVLYNNSDWDKQNECRMFPSVAFLLNHLVADVPIIYFFCVWPNFDHFLNFLKIFKQNVFFLETLN